MKRQFVPALVPLLLLISAVVSFMYSHDTHTYHEDFRAQAVFLFGVIFAGQLLVEYYHGQRRVLAPLSIQAISSIILGYPITGEVGTELLLYSAILINFTLAAPFALTMLLMPVYVLITLRNQSPVVLWGEPAPGATPSESVLLGAIQLSVIILGATIAWYHKELSAKRRSLQQMEDTITQLSSANIGFQEYADTIVERSLDNERKRISRELHDTVGYALTNIRMLMEEAIGSYDGQSDNMFQLLTTTRDQARETLHETRTTLRKLRQISRVADDSDLRAVSRIVAAFQRATGIHVSIDRANTRSTYTPEIDRIIYRFLQESMTNAFRHGRASRIQIYMFEIDDKLKVYVDDDGIGCPDVKEGIGLTGMRERLEDIGGDLTLEGTAHGFQVRAIIPIDAGNRNEFEHTSRAG